MSVFSRPRVFSRFGPVGGAWAEPVAPLLLPAGEAEKDEFGLARTIYGKAPRLSRQYVAKCLEFLGLPKTVNPTVMFGPGQGTIPELVVFGWLINNHYRYQTYGPMGFFWQTNSLGGRQSGGAVVDFDVWLTTARRIAVNVDSPFHGPENPYGAGQKMERDRRRNIRLQSTGAFSAVLSVNRREWGYPLSTGTNDAAVAADLTRIAFA